MELSELVIDNRGWLCLLYKGRLLRVVAVYSDWEGTMQVVMNDREE